MKKIWLGIGAAVIVILLLLQTKFNVFMRLEQNGYAVADSEIKKTLMLDPEEVELDTSFEHYHFEALDYIYQRGNKYYMGEKKKQEIDLGFPLYVNGGAGILFTDDSGTLFDVDFETAESYSGLTVSEGISYNPGGSRADATEYIFSELANGMFVNLDVLSYEDRGEKRDVDRNSIIYFTEEYFTYSEQEGGVGNYQVCRTISADDIITIHGQELTYHELLLKLQIISEKKTQDSEVPEETVPAETLTPEQAELEDGQVMESEEGDAEEENEEEANELEKTDSTADKEGTEEKEQTQQGSKQNSASSSPASKPQTPSKQPSSNEPPRGTRPDNLRPDKETPVKPVEGYVKPTVTVNSVTAGVYRIMLDVTVNDPARRLHTLRKVQFEFYEVGSDGKETLVYRTYTASSNSKLSAGDGSIKPDTTYRINAYFTYYDEYNNMIVESIPLDTIITDSKVTTGSLSSVGSINVGSPQPEYYYDSYLELPAVRYVDPSDEEALYGINRNAGMKIIVEGNSLTTSGFKAETILDATTIRNFKNGVSVDFVSAANLTPKEKYKFTIAAEDYFGNQLTLRNNTGEFETCKSRPVASLEITENKLGNFKMQVEVNDVDESAILNEAEEGYDIYLVYSTERSEVEAITKEECDAYIANGGPVEGSKVAFAYKFSAAEYMDANGNLKIDQIVETTKLDLNVRYFAYLYCDYNLNNKKGDVRFGEIASLKFTSASLSSLGDIYVKVDISNVTAHSANIAFTLNGDRTVDELEKLLSSVRFDIVRTGGEEEITDSYMQFDTNAMTEFSGYDHGSNETPKGFPWEETGVFGTVMMDARFFDSSLSEEQHELKSMTDYSIEPVIKATYNGKEYDMKVRLTTSSFKTMKEPATIEVENLLLAAGRLRFNVKVNDPDGAIIGNSGHTVRMNLYQQDGTFVKAIRIPKNTEDFQEIEISGLNNDKRFKLTFIAMEYNEGYTNSTYASNKILKEILIDDSIELSGTIKLQEIVAGDSSSKLDAKVKVSLIDENKILNNGCYYIQVQKNGEDVTQSANYPASYDVPGNGGDYTGTEITEDFSFEVDKGRNTYQLTLYTMINGQKLVLDTVTFTSEKTVTGINSPEEFIWKIKNDPSGKFVVTKNIVLDSETSYKNPNDENESATPKRIVKNFNGQIDFQGYNLDYTYCSSGSGLFANLGSQSDVSNMVFNVKMENAASAVWDDGVFCRVNYGNIHDVMVNFKGAEVANNQHIGLLARINAVSGTIENFVVSNEPEEGMMPFTVWRYGGLVCSSNQGIVRNGYAYGDPIFTDIEEPSVGGELQVGGIVGFQSSLGRLNNVYSMVNVTVANKKRAADQNTDVWAYGSVAGRAYGRVSNAYGIGESFYNQALDGVVKNTSVGPAVGYFDGRTDNVYYWNETDTDYTDTKQKRIGLESLYDYGWQSELLGGQFTTANVEVGYYPHVLLSDELPNQPNIPLPERAGANLVELVSAEVVEYVDEKQAAIVNFRFSNTQNAEITKINILNLTTEIDADSVNSADGFTNLQAKISNPTKFCSSYEIEGVECYLRGTRTVDFDPNPILLVDFYRNISTPDEWYEYVVKQPTENARLTGDIDFSGVPADRIVVTKEYTGKLDGGSADENSTGYTIKNITIQDNQWNNVFANNVRGAITNLCVENLTLGTESNVISRAGFIRGLYGVVDNVHMQNVSVIGYEYIGGMVSSATYGAEITNSSISNVKIEYKEPANVNTVGRVGGLAGYTHETRVTNCYVRDLDMTVADIRECEGAGGLVGYASISAIDSAYSTGTVTARGVRVGGIVGYYTNNEAGISIKNLLSGTDVFSYQDKIGGLVGEASVSTSLDDRNNVSGVAFGNVFANNPDAQSVSYTIGDMAGVQLSFHGSEVQLLNGLIGQEKDDNTLRILSLEQIQNADTYTEEAGMDDVFDYSKAEDNHFPVLYYEGTNIPLPFQSDIPLSSTEISKNEITVNEVILNDEENRIILEVNTLDNAEYQITGVEIENLIQDTNKNLSFVASNRLTDGGGRILTHYLPEEQQKHWQDSYLLTRINYTKNVNGNSIQGYADFSEDPVRIPLTLYADIHNVETWEHYINADNNYGNYENYRITKDINFANSGYTYNAKLGRLKGDTGTGNGTATLSGINLSGPRTNFIFRLNTEMSNLAFENCSITSTERDGVGLVGASAADVHDIAFKNVIVTNKTLKINTAGLIAYQVGGSMQDITMEGIKIVCDKESQSFIGGLVGYSTGSVLYKNINGKEIEVTGSSCIGGLVGKTTRAYFEDITFEDIKVTGRSTYVGGIVGNNDSPRTSKNAPYMWNVSIKGTPSKDTDGRVVDSTTVIAVNTKLSNVNYIGGIAGRCVGYQIGFGRPAGTGSNAINVEGIVVKAAGSYVGGAFGESYGCQNVTVKDVLITGNNKLRTKVQSQVGGISGRQHYENSYNNVYNVKIDVEDYRQVGLVSGYRLSNGASYYCYAHDSEVVATRTARVSEAVWDVGGVFGRNDNQVNFCGAYNCKVLAASEVDSAGYANVGGLVGYSSGVVNKSFYYVEPQSETDPTAKADYKVQGGSHVGGIVGNLGSGGITLCYSNANVIADGKYAGGMTGYYNNAYTTSKVSGKTVYAYSGVYLKYSYFAGTVKAKSCAGGAIGANSMSIDTGVAEAHRKNGGRSTDVSDANGGLKSGSKMEWEYTTKNMILAKTVSADDGNAYAFSGTQDGFEGKANLFNHEPVKNNTTKDKPSRTLLFAGMKVGKTGVEQELYYMSNDGVPEWAKNEGTSYRYEMWNPAEENLGADANGCWPRVNARLITTEDLQGIEQYNTFKALAWVTEKFNSTTTNTMKAYTHRLIYSEANNSAEWDAIGDADQYQGKDYLPHVRVNSSFGAIADQLVKKQSSLKIALPIPKWEYTERTATTTLSLREVPQTYATVYPVDADRINVEFSQDLVDYGGYFTLSYGNEVISQQLIKQRVYTYSYDYAKNLKLTYGYADLESIYEQMVEAGMIEADTVLTEEQEQKIFTYEDWVWELDTISYSSASLSRHVMVYGNEYYYISEDGIVHGFGSSSSSQDTGDDTSSDDGKVVDETAQTMAGSYITIYNGHGLSEDGSVIDVSSGGTIRTAGGCTQLSEVATLQSFDYGGYGIETYAKFSEVFNTDVVAKEAQVLKGYTGNVGFIDGRLENIKDSLLLYTKDGKEYQTILGVDGIMIDMFQGDDINAPEDFKSSGIVYMTNNLNSNVPFVLVEYQNGGIVGYNYMTGEYLFDNSVRNVMSLLDYTKVYFEGDKSMYAQVSSSYAVNRETAEIIGTSERLLELVEGNSENIDVQGNSSGDGTKSENEIQEKAGDEVAKTSNKTALSESGSVGDKLTDENDSSEQGNAKEEDGKVTELDSNGKAVNGAAEGNNSTTESTDGTVQNSNNENSELTSVVGVESGNPVTDDEKIIGVGKGQGDIVISGTSTANGTNTEITGSVGGVSSGTADESSNTPGTGDNADKAGNSTDSNVDIDEVDISSLSDENSEGGADTEEGGTSDVKSGADTSEDGVPVVEVGKDVKESGTTAEDGAGAAEDDANGEANAEQKANVKTTTAGTTVQPDNNINNGDSNSPSLGTLDDKDDEDSKTNSSDTSSAETQASGLITVYNQSTGTYEIVDVEQYFNIPVYQSENQKLCIHDLSAYAGYAEEEVEKEEADGLLLYVLVAFAIVGGVGFTYYYRKKAKYSR